MDKDSINLMSILQRNLEHQDYIEKECIHLYHSMGIQSVQDVKILLDYINKLEQEIKFTTNIFKIEDDEEFIKVHCNDSYICTLNHDDDGWAGMDRIKNIIIKIADIIGAEIKD